MNHKMSAGNTCGNKAVLVVECSASQSHFFNLFTLDPNTPNCLSRHRKTLLKNWNDLLVIIILIRGHSTTTWTKFYPILTHHDLRVDKNGHFTFYKLFATWFPADFLITPSSTCQSMYLMNVPLLEWSLHKVQNLLLCIFTRCRELIVYKFNKYTKA